MVVLSIALIYALTITLLSLNESVTDIHKFDIEHLDKVVHFCFYFGLNLLLMLMIFAVRRKRLKIYQILLSTLLTLSYSIAIELVQPLFGRGFSSLDIVANTIGCFVAAIAFYCFRRYAGK